MAVFMVSTNFIQDPLSVFGVIRNTETAAVNRTLLSADMSRKRRGEVVDKLAATYILQGALDRLKTIDSNAGGFSYNRF